MTRLPDIDNNKQNEFIELVRAHEGIIYKVLGLYTDSKEEEKDLKQEMLLQAWKAFGSFRKEAKFSTWLFRVCLNVALNHLKKKKKYKQTEPIEALDQRIERDNEDYEILFYLIKKLNDIDRMLMTLHLDGYKNMEIAEITGIKQNNVNVKIHRIKKTLIDKFKRINND